MTSFSYSGQLFFFEFLERMTYRDGQGFRSVENGLFPVSVLDISSILKADAQRVKTTYLGVGTGREVDGLVAA
jgi:hypothetical protein